MGARGIGLLTGVLLLCGAPAVVAAGAPLSGDVVFLPNLDDDQHRCQVDPADLDRPGPEADVRLAACNDAADDQVNGARDELDLARVQVGRVGGTAGQVTVDGQARVFVKRNGGFSPDTRLSGAELRHGVELGVEGRDIVRDPARWDGWVTVKLTVDGKLKASHRMRVAPLLLQNDLQRATTVFAARPGQGPGWPDAVPLPQGFPEGWDEFSTPLREEAKTKFITGTAQWWKDVWWQDLFEPASASMPTRHGTQTMRVAIRSANVFDMGSGPTPRPAGRLLFRDFRGPDVAVVQEYTVESRYFGKDLINATGNIETVPPYPGFPQGRLVYGSGASRQPDPAFIKMLTAQGRQPPIVLDTTWLAVGHVDEPLHVVRANNSRGWTLVVADPRLAVGLLKQVPPPTKLLENTAAGHKPTAAELLADQKFLTGNETAARHIDDMVRVMLTETGLRPDELLHVPVLFQELQTFPLFVAFTPGIPNGLSVNEHLFLPPDPHGPVVRGRDVFKEVTERALAANQVRVRWVDDFSWAHQGGGEVHCTTNAWRDVG